MSRATFTTSRLLDFFSEDELRAQTGHPASEWPLVIIKELIDNALDACEEAGIPPEVEVVVDGDGITVVDNGPGIPPGTVAGIVDFDSRTSSREAYVAPDRGAQGNAMKTMVAMPYVLDGSHGRVTITARGIRHEIVVSVDRVRQRPVINHVPRHDPDVKIATSITVGLPGLTLLNQPERPWFKHRFLQFVAGFAWVNLHARLVVDWFGDKVVHEPTGAGWAKWTPAEPTSAHWYSVDHLERLVAAYVAHPEHAAMSVREFVTGFRGLSASAKARRCSATRAWPAQRWLISSSTGRSTPLALPISSRPCSIILAR